jgi:hypothetical protein
MRLPKLNKQQIKESLEQTPAHVVLTGNRRLTSKQKAFCKNIVEGMNQVDAHANAYQWSGKRKNISNKASEMMKDGRIQAEIDALERAKEFNAMYSSAQLRTLVISQLTKEAVDPKSKPSERISALSKLGQVAELGVFIQRTETTVIKDSASARTELMEQLKKAMGESMRTVDEAEDDDAQELLNLINNSAPNVIQDLADPPTPDPDSDKNGDSHLLHSNPDKRLSDDSIYVETFPDREGVQISHPDWEETRIEKTPLNDLKQKG